MGISFFDRSVNNCLEILRDAWITYSFRGKKMASWNHFAIETYLKMKYIREKVLSTQNTVQLEKRKSNLFDCLHAHHYVRQFWKCRCKSSKCNDNCILLKTSQEKLHLCNMWWLDNTQKKVVAAREKVSMNPQRLLLANSGRQLLAAWIIEILKLLYSQLLLGIHFNDVIRSCNWYFTLYGVHSTISSVN